MPCHLFSAYLCLKWLSDTGLDQLIIKIKRKVRRKDNTMKKGAFLTIFSILLAFLTIQAVPAAQQQFPGLESSTPLFKTVTPAEAKQMIDNRKELLLVDVRGADELNEGYIEGSTLMPLWDILKGTQRPPKNKPILLICAVGGRSLALGKLMSKNGWPEIYNLKGGISAWKEARLPVKY
jgi:rhodanese-related sulfurtransferase